MTEHQPVVGDRLTVGASAGRVPGRCGPVAGDRVGVAGLSRVVDDARQVGVLPSDQRVEHPPVQFHPACHRQRVRHRPAGELVPERHRSRRHGEQAVLLGHRQRGQPARHEGVDQPPLHRGRDHGELVERALAGRVQAAHPGQHRIGDRGGDAVPVSCREDLGDEERVARRHGEHLVGVDPAGGAQPPDRVRRQAPQWQPLDPARGRRLAEQLLQGMLSGQLVVAVGQHQHRRQAGDPACQVSQHVQGGLVGPVHVLHHQDGRVPGPVQLGPQRGQHCVPLAALGQRPGQLGADLADQVPERPQGPRGAEVVAVADQQAPLGRQQPAQRPDQARLADAGLAGDEHQPALAGRRLVGGLGELGELAVAFEKHQPCHIASIAGDWTRDHGQSARLPMDLACSRWVLVDPDGSRRVPSDRLDDQTDDQGLSDRIGCQGKQVSPRAHG